MGPRYVKSYKYVIIIVQFKKKGYNILHVTLNQKNKIHILLSKKIILKILLLPLT